MRSTFIHIRGSNRQEVADALGGFDSHGVYIDFYEDHLTEYEPEDVDALKERLGVFPPDVTVMADLSGKIIGYDESLRLARFLLTRFTGVIQDDGDGIWTLDELVRDIPSVDGYFMENSRRHAGLKIPAGEKDAQIKS